jgi:hypothetical protein
MWFNGLVECPPIRREADDFAKNRFARIEFGDEAPYT